MSTTTRFRSSKQALDPASIDTAYLRQITCKQTCSLPRYRMWRSTRDWAQQRRTERRAA